MTNILLGSENTADIADIISSIEELSSVNCVSLNTGFLKKINESSPAIILIHSPGFTKSDQKILTEIRKNEDQKNIPIFVFTAINDEEKRKLAFDHGCIDYFYLPFNKTEIFGKINCILSHVSEIENQKAQAVNNMNMAMTLMSQNGETGHVLNFLKDSFLCKSVKELCEKLLDTCSAYDLKITIRPNTENIEYFTHDEAIKDIDKQILDSLNNRERLIYFGQRCIVNFDNISILIKNMPIDDDEKNGRLKDHIALVVEGADARMVSLLNEQKLESREQGLAQMLASTKVILTEIDASFQNNAKQNSTIMSELGKKIEWTLVKLGLSSEQENTLLSTIDDAINGSSSLYESGLDIDSKLEKLTQELANIIGEK